MRWRKDLRIVLAAVVAAIAALLVLPQVAGAVLSGTNGRIVFASGRDQASDAEAKLRFWRIPPTALDPAVSDPLTPSPGQHRHPSWSPDRTRIVYARGPAPYDLFILDLTAPPGTAPANITQTPAVSEDRPAWSPDGTRIAYETDGGDILVDALPAGGPVNFTANEAAPASKPAWTPDSQTIFYTSGAINPAGDASIVRKAANNAAGQPSGVTFGPTINEHQASVSPDGTKLCFTRGPFDGTADVIVSLLNGGGQTILSNSNAGTLPENGDYNCTWSPDGTQVAYVRGTFGLGDLVVERADGSEFAPRALVETAGRFDGNPDWAPDGRPACQPRTVSTLRNTPVAIVLSCPDTGPAYERTPVRVNVADEPANGTIPADVGPPGAGTETRTYTPRAGFTGTDTFTYNALDQIAFGPRVTVAVNVRAPGAGGSSPGVRASGALRCGGRPTTLVGTGRRDRIFGTPRRDVIAALGGNDVVFGRGGNDLLCLGNGKDRGSGGAGRDRILGQGGSDRLLGGPGADVMLGGPGRDVILGGAGRDRALGGAGRDACAARITRSC
jgi:Tol biopolymer transport system component